MGRTIAGLPGVARSNCRALGKPRGKRLQGWRTPWGSCWPHCAGSSATHFPDLGAFSPGQAPPSSHPGARSAAAPPKPVSPGTAQQVHPRPNLATTVGSGPRAEMQLVRSLSSPPCFRPRPSPRPLTKWLERPLRYICFPVRQHSATRPQFPGYHRPSEPAPRVCVPRRLASSCNTSH